MSYTPHTLVQYRLAEDGELDDGCLVDMRTPAANRVAVLFSPPQIDERLTHQLTRLSSHQVAHGAWRQSGSAVPEGQWLSVTRWERVPGSWLPTGWLVLGVEEAGSCIWLVNEDACTQRLQHGMNDLLYRLASKGVYLQCWFRCSPPPAGALPEPVLRPSAPLAAL
ncbi:hypothetical protein ACWD11_22595 [Streptomyces sp. NPDC002776]